jgi:phosphoribosylformylglycinamidine synthase
VRATILVRPKPGILDPQGEAVQSSLRQLGFDVEGARVGRVIDLELGAGTANGDTPASTHEQLERMCRQLLANPLIESFEIAVEE